MQETTRTAHRPAGPKANVLLVDDQPANLLALEAILQDLGLNLIRVASGEEARGMMERQVGHLVRLVDDLLDVSRIMQGRVELRQERVDLVTVVGRAVETAQPAIDAHGHQLTVSLPPRPVVVHADLVRLSQVISNLLTNAPKYTPQASRIWLTAECEGGEVVVRVRDTGSGIAPESLVLAAMTGYGQDEDRRRSREAGFDLHLTKPLDPQKLEAVAAAPHPS